MSEITAALIALQEQAVRIGALDQREGDHWRQVLERFGAITERLGGIDGTLADVGAVLGTVAEVARDLEELRDLIEGRPEGEGERYMPTPPPRLHEMDEGELTALVRRLKGWVSTVYVPGYGHLAAALEPCWPSHALCVHALDWLSELWSVLYMQPDRSAPVLSGMAEFQTRILPAIVAQMTAEQRECSAASEHVTRTRRPALRQIASGS